MSGRANLARRLRRDQTPAERYFWDLLHPWRLSGHHFRRQSPIGLYIVDVVCKRQSLIIEIDGDSHFTDEGLASDAVRTAYLESIGFRIIRFTNADVLENPDGVFDVLRKLLGDPGSTPT